MRFYFYPYTFKSSFTHPTESLFVPAFAVSFGTILINIVEYGFGKVGNWLNEAVVVLFWFDLEYISFCTSLKLLNDDKVD
jgi:tellurite resistance protein TehA-like permease